MRALCDLHLALPYRAVAPWPVIEYNGNLDWVASVDCVESWLEQYVGHHHSHWTWSMWTLHNPNLCCVSFARERDTTLFLLRFS